MLKEIEALETSLALDAVTPEILLELGTSIARKALDENLPIGVEIRLGELCAFCFAARDVSPNTQNWINRKLNTCDFFGHSTLWVYEKTGGDASLLDTKYRLDLHLATNAPGGIPLILKGFGKVGAIAVSGLAAQDDHDLIVDALRNLQAKVN
ncbi:MAG: heme-binding protein [Anaerolineaceae bacterium]|jgi:uncharacterized protein (UPF0303 family)|uniref:Heme-degrading domain-containing protein n=1 Tax=Candidatus Dojkabacteria bacterium TaxID=2099670 RepID=A0A847D138_9BACT|nr:heme-binding protein [Anaerolineaceae bacterium]MDI9531780.1 heme-binding protein [Chloroflexota bacterium]NLD25719.1 hypothetical protein [Candidatus Dojkabacteria bacterium]